MAIKIHRKPIKNLILRVTPNLEVILSVPLDTCQKEIDRILNKRAKWIEEKLKFFKDRQTPKRLLVSGEDFFYLGKRYRLKIIEDTSNEVALRGKFLYVHLKNTQDYRAKELMIQQWYRERAQNVFATILANYSKRLGLDFQTYSIRTMKTMWGNCKINSRHITLNLELIKKPKRSIEYVVLHELAHIKYPYHNRDFYNYIHLYMPDWENARSKLNG
ncbi:hypothetical protein BBW65_00615 [Helicobacter enhydrae]|uniref:YgjP-like metallopeptidase domain-containing protein n=1 Tax=Helicobacter enhydrae TaxID=222136 RepID=A0A1B1U3S7_9HELI|nr:SprT family zinc-dependent metalloprotease [Helicobacter enhydrae]ANV97409.1 hypothetical protein BBW65_00615 [Helicobacter enhydrae]